MLPFYLLRWPRPDRMAAGIEVTMRNINLALLLASRLFPEPDALGNGVLFVSLFYAAVAMGAGLPLALNHRRLARKEKPVLDCQV
jgi:BASS family bile acid:Na+ symporter